MRLSAIRALTSRNRTAVRIDFFGIRNITNKDIAAAYANKTQLLQEDLLKKYDPLLVKRNQFANESKEENCTFGYVRRDDEHKVKYHGQYEETSTKTLYDTVTVKQAFVSDHEEAVTLSSLDTLAETPVETIGNPAVKISEIEAIENLDTILGLFKESETFEESVARYLNVPPLTYFFENSDMEENKLSKIKKTEISADTLHTKNLNRNEKDKQAALESSENTANQANIEVRMPQYTMDQNSGPEGVEVPLHELDPLSIEYEERLAEEEKKSRFDCHLDRKYEETKNKATDKTRKKAIDHLKEIRSQCVEPESKRLQKELIKRPYPLEPSVKLDSKGKRNYKYQVPDWYAARRVDILDFLKNNIIYNNNDILAINKPYGLISHADETEKPTYDINSLMTELARSIFRIDRIYLAHRLDKTTTGVLLFATSKLRADFLNKQFKFEQVKKTYFALTRGAPNPPEGIIDMPIGEFKSSGRTKMCPVPNNLKGEMQIVKRFTEARRAVTQYRTLQVGKGNISLVEVKPRSGVKHQIRCHLGFGLLTPILGDHKYTDIARMTPQKLSPQALAALQLRQSKVRTLPIHLHARTIVIPDAKASGETLFISAPLPPHFLQNMRALNLKCLS